VKEVGKTENANRSDIASITGNNMSFFKSVWIKGTTFAKRLAPDSTIALSKEAKVSMLDEYSNLVFLKERCDEVGLLKEAPKNPIMIDGTNAKKASKQN